MLEILEHFRPYGTKDDLRAKLHTWKHEVIFELYLEITNQQLSIGPVGTPTPVLIDAIVEYEFSRHPQAFQTGARQADSHRTSTTPE